MPRPVARSTSGSVSSRRPCAWTCSASQPRIAVTSARGERLVLRAEVALERLPQLRGDQAPERVAGEVAERARGPVRVLQDAGRVVGDLDAEQPPHAVVPGRGQVGHVEAALDSASSSSKRSTMCSG